MPVGRRFDFQLGGRGFMLARGEYRGRAWQRTGRSDTPGQRSQTDAQYGMLPDELDHPEVWNDWSGGFGFSNRETGANTYHWCENFDARIPNQLIHAQRLLEASGAWTGSVGAVYGIFDEAITTTDPAEAYRQGAGELVILGDHGVAGARPSDNGGLATFNISGITGSINYGFQPAMFGSFAYHPIISYYAGSAYFIQEDSSGSLVSAPMSARSFMVVGNRLWRSCPASRSVYVQSCAAGADPTATANWSATIAVGNGWQQISTLLAYDEQLVCGMADGMYVGDSSGTFVNVLPVLGYNVNDDNCRDLCVHDNAIIAPHLGGLYRYRPDAYTARVDEIGPGVRSSRSPVRGRFRTVRSYGGWLYAGMWTGSANYILVGQERAPNVFAWHPLWRVPAIANGVRRIGALHFDHMTTYIGGTINCPTRFWQAYDASLSDVGTRLKITYLPIPAGNGNPLSAPPPFSANYMGSARIDLGKVDWDAPATPKIFRMVEMETEHLASGAQWCNVYYTVDNEGTRHLLGTVGRSPHDAMYFSSGEGSFVTGHNIELSLESFTASPNVTPVYRTLILRGALQPRSNDMITAVVRVADGLRDRRGAEMRSGATMLDELRSLGDPDRDGLQAHQMIDLSGAVQWVKVLGRVGEQEYFQQGDENPEIAATVRMAVLSYSSGG